MWGEVRMRERLWERLVREVKEKRMTELKSDEGWRVYHHMTVAIRSLENDERDIRAVADIVEDGYRCKVTVTVRIGVKQVAMPVVALAAQHALAVVLERYVGCPATKIDYPADPDFQVHIEEPKGPRMNAYGMLPVAPEGIPK